MTLLTQSADDLTLAEALERCAASLAFGEMPAVLLYSASRCAVAGLSREGDLRACDGRVVDTRGVFEARAFAPRCELRWLHRAGGRGRAVLLSEEPLGPVLGESTEVKELVKTLDQRYLVWGAVNGNPGPGWCAVAESQIGQIDLPVDARAGRRIQVVAREYLGRVGDHGNVAVVEERLVKLEVANG